jgi:hypothetical protein
LQIFVDKRRHETRRRPFGTALLKTLLIGCCVIVVLYIGASIFGAMIFMGWGGIIPAQVQVTLDRKETPYDDVLKAIASSAAKQGYSLNYYGEKPAVSYGFLMDKTKTIHVDIGSPSANADPMFSVVDRKNANQSIYVAKVMSDDLSRIFPVKRIYVQIDPKQYDCVKSGCTFEMSSPIDLDKLPRWLGSK